MTANAAQLEDLLARIQEAELAAVRRTAEELVGKLGLVGA